MTAAHLSSEIRFDMPHLHGIVERLVRDPRGGAPALVAGLRARAAAIPPKYFYDRLGCALYGAICELPEYYPTRTERAIFDENRDDIASAIGTGTQFVDLGAGDCCKARALAAVPRARALPRGRHRRATRSRASLARMAPDFPEIEMLGVVTDFTRRPRPGGATSTRDAGHVLLSGLVDRQLHARRGARVPADAARCIASRREAAAF